MECPKIISLQKFNNFINDIIKNSNNPVETHNNIFIFVNNQFDYLTEIIKKNDIKKFLAICQKESNSINNTSIHKEADILIKNNLNLKDLIIYLMMKNY